MAVMTRRSQRHAPIVVLETESGAASSSASSSNSPTESPKQSPSTTSLSSLASDADGVAVLGAKSSTAKRAPQMIDTNGNAFELPDFTIKQIRDAIPPHCFRRSYARSLGYLARDLTVLATVFLVCHHFVTPEYVPSRLMRAMLWTLYTVVQGMVGTGVWVLAHECGHGAFSDSKTLNDVVGWVCHSAMLVPYFSWKISHGKHHKATGHMERDMVWTPKTRSEYARNIGRYVHELAEVAEETPIVTAGHLLLQQLVGWPVYLITNATGHDCHERQPEGRGKGKKNGMGGAVNHFDPASPLYEAKDAHLIALSDLGLGLMTLLLTALVRSYGWSNMLVWYFVPYLWVNHWLVVITYLQHTDPELPHYQPEAWNFARGAAATIDRDFGFIGRHVFHGIIETHVLHHFVSSIPFYNADEASDAIRPVMGKHYRSNTDGGAWGFLRAFWRSMRTCNWVEPTAGATGEAKHVLFFRNRNGIGPQPTTLEVVKPAA